MEDIERIEVFRGPNTVSYGANALMAVVNILTRSPASSQGSRIKVVRGERGINDFYASQGVGWETGDLRLSLSGQQDDGFDSDAAGADRRDGRRLNRFSLAVSQTLNAQQSLDWQLNVKEGTNQRPYTYTPVFAGITEGGSNSDVTAKDYAGSCAGTSTSTPTTACISRARHSNGTASKSGKPVTPRSRSALN